LRKERRATFHLSLAPSQAELLRRPPNPYWRFVVAYFSWTVTMVETKQMAISKNIIKRDKGRGINGMNYVDISPAVQIHAVPSLLRLNKSDICRNLPN